ncbi:MAG: YibE/F family protein [Anaerovoracaceae bacterium]|jgi:uncharacterized membrane protein
MTLLILTVILIALILLFCGDKGVRAIISTVMNAGILLISLFLMYHGLSPILVTTAACVIITAVTLFYQNEINVKSRVSFFSVLIVIAVMVPLIAFFASGANAEGFNSEQYEITDSNGFTRNIDLSMFQIQVSIMLIALIGTVIDTAVAITSSIWEIRSANPDITRKELTRSSFLVSKSIMATSIHTIFYIYIAEYLTLLIQYLTDYSFAYVLNSKSLAGEFITISMTGCGCCLVCPVATILGILLIHGSDNEGAKEKKKEPELPSA